MWMDGWGGWGGMGPSGSDLRQTSPVICESHEQ